MEISVSTGLYYKKNYEEILDIIASTSCKNIELFLNQAFIDVPILELEKEISKRNLNVLSIHTPLEFISFTRKESEEYWINKSIEIAKLLGSKVIVSHMVYGKYFDDKIKDLDEIHKQNMLHYNKNKNIYITTENLPCFIESCFLANLDKLFEFIDANKINLTFDTTHCAFGDFPIIDTFNKFKRFIKNIHLSDFGDGIEHKILGAGNLPLKDFIVNLKNESYEGLLTLELDFDNKKRNNIENNEQAILAIEKSLEFINGSFK